MRDCKCPPNITLVERTASFWESVHGKPGECWPWPGYVTSVGYGQTHFMGRTDGVHRIAYTLVHGPIPAGCHIDHICHNNAVPKCTLDSACPHRRCCNPAHLEAVTPRVNTLRGQTPAARHAASTHCPQGHAYTPENTATYTVRNTSRVYRSCITCQHNRNARRKEARREKGGGR